jgi:PPOX class probable F420-dependent enzyme
LYVTGRASGNHSDEKLELTGATHKSFAALYNNGMAIVPAEIHGQRYISLATFRKSGVAVYTPIWFAESDNKLYFMTSSKMTSSKLGKCKRIRNNPQVKIAPCTIRGKITGPEFPATARFLPNEEATHIRQLINEKYWLARLPFLWRNTDTYLEITPASA